MAKVHLQVTPDLLREALGLPESVSFVGFQHDITRDVLHVIVECGDLDAGPIEPGDAFPLVDGLMTVAPETEMVACRRVTVQLVNRRGVKLASGHFYKENKTL